MPEQRCGLCRHAIWPKDRRGIGKCRVSKTHEHCGDTWPDGRMMIKARWGTKCPQFGEESR